MTHRKSHLDKLELLTEKMAVFVGDGAATMIKRNSGIAKKLKNQKERIWVNDLVSIVFFKKYGVQKRPKINHVMEVVLGTVNFIQAVPLVMENL